MYGRIEAWVALLFVPQEGAPPSREATDLYSAPSWPRPAPPRGAWAPQGARPSKRPSAGLRRGVIKRRLMGRRCLAEEDGRPKGTREGESAGRERKREAGPDDRHLCALEWWRESVSMEGSARRVGGVYLRGWPPPGGTCTLWSDPCAEE